MTRPIFEPTDDREFAKLAHGQRQLFRRPGDEASADAIVIQLKICGDDVVVAVGDDQFFLGVSEDMDGMDLIACAAWVSTPSSSGLVEVRIRNETQGANMLSTDITIDVGETNSKTAATPPVINTGADDVLWADFIGINVDSAGTGARGLGVDMTFALP